MPGTPIEQLVIDNIVSRLEAMDGSGYVDAEVADAYTYEFATVSTIKKNVLDLAEAAKPAVLVTTEEEIPFLHAGDVAESGMVAPLSQILVYRDMPVTLAFAFDAVPSDPTDPDTVDRDTEGRLMLADIYKCIIAMDHSTLGGSPIDIKMGASQVLLTEIASPLVYGGLRFTVLFQHRYGTMTQP